LKGLGATENYPGVNWNCLSRKDKIHINWWSGFHWGWFDYFSFCSTI